MSANKPPSELLNVCNVLVEDGDSFLLVQEAEGVAVDKWNIPGGHADPGESLEDAAAREFREETGLDVRLLRPLLETPRPEDGVNLHSFLGVVTGGQLSWPPDEIKDARWFPKKTILAMLPELRDPDYIVGTIKVV